MEYWYLSTQVGNDNEMQSALKEGYELLRKAEKTWNKKLYEDFKREYDELEKVMKETIADSKRISKEERAKIMLELWDIVHLAEKNWIVEKKWLTSSFWDWIKWTNTQEAKEKAQNLRNKNVNEFTKDEAISAMEYLSKNYKRFKVAEDSDKIALFYSTINELDDQYEVRKFQEKLSEKIFWVEKQFNNEFVQWFNNERWNYIVKITNFEQILSWNNIKDVNSLALANYIKHLNAKWEATPEKILNKFGQWNLEQLSQLWEWNKDTIVQKELNKLWLWSIIETIKMFSSTENFLNWVSWLEKNGKLWELAIKYLERNREAITKKFSDYLKKTIDKDFPNKSPKEKEAILKSIMWEFEWVKNSTDLTKIAEKIIQVKEKYKLNSLSWKDVANQVQELWKTNNRIDETNNDIKITQEKEALAIATKNNDLEWINRHTQRIRTLEWKRSSYKKREVQFATNAAILKRIDEKTITQIWTWEKKLEDIVTELRKNDKSFDDELKKYENIEKSLEKSSTSISKENDSKIEVKTFTYENGETFEYSKSWNSYNIKTEMWSIDISSDEFAIITKNEKAKENLVKFKQTLSDLWLWKIWKYRIELFTAIGNKIGRWFQLNDDYLNENETFLFVKEFMNSIKDETKIDVSWDGFQTMKRKIKEINIWTFWNKIEVKSNWRSGIEDIFIKKFVKDWKFIISDFAKSFK